MSNRPDSFMPLWIGDYLGDTMRLTRDQHGGYLLLIMDYWRQGEALPDDDEALAAITKASALEWKKLRPVLAKFFVVADGKWTHGRIEEELKEAQEHYNAKVERAKHAAERRWGKNASGYAQASGKHKPKHPASNAKDMLEECQSQPQPQDFPNFVGESRSGVERGARAPKKGASPRPPTSNWEQTMPKWAEFREKIGEAHWVNWFDQCRTNGSETTILAPSEFQADQLKFRYLTALKDHFGPSVYIKFDPEKWNPKAGAKP